jgi:XTP/dITP diphosphohydrolase
MQSITIATHNQHKFIEIASMLAPIQCLKLNDKFAAPEETGLSFIENAIIKARYTCHLTQGPCIADDSGIVVPFLNGAPGIYSARYAGGDANDTTNRNKLLAALKLAQGKERSAYFYCAMVYLAHEADPAPLIGLGKWQGMVHTHAQGKHGFGYDPIFYLPELEKTAAELSPEEKNQLSHRGQALQQLTQALTQTFTFFKSL